jgi:3-dehydroquinate synthase
MLCASRLAEKVGRIDKALTKRQEQLLVALGLPTAVPNVDHDDVIMAMQRDKKVAHGKLRFVLPTQLGHVELVDNIKPELAREILQQT